MVNFECCSHTQQHQEPEIHHGVHKARGAVAQQCAHVDTCAVISETTLDVLWSCTTTIGRTTLPVTNAICETERTPHNHHGDDGVEGNLYGAGNATKDFAMNLRRALPSSDGGKDAREHREGAYSYANCNRQLIGAKTLWGLVGLRNSVGAHNGYNASAIWAQTPDPSGQTWSDWCEKSAVVGAIKFTNSGSESLEQLGGDGGDVLDCALESTVCHNEQTHISFCDDSGSARAFVEQ